MTRLPETVEHYSNDDADCSMTYTTTTPYDAPFADTDVTTRLDTALAGSKDQDGREAIVS